MAYGHNRPSSYSSMESERCKTMRTRSKWAWPDAHFSTDFGRVWFKRLLLITDIVHLPYPAKPECASGAQSFDYFHVVCFPSICLGWVYHMPVAFTQLPFCKYCIFGWYFRFWLVIYLAILRDPVINYLRFLAWHPVHDEAKQSGHSPLGRMRAQSNGRPASAFGPT